MWAISHKVKEVYTWHGHPFGVVGMECQCDLGLSFELDTVTLTYILSGLYLGNHKV